MKIETEEQLLAALG